MTENAAGHVAEAGILAVRHGFLYSKVPVVAAVAVDQTVWADVLACIATEYVPASVSTSDAANVIVLPETVIKEGVGPPVTAN